MGSYVRNHNDEGVLNVIRRQALAMLVFSALLVAGHPAHACRYNVREVGFIDIGMEPYWLFVYTGEGTSEEEATALRGRVDAALAETNVQCELVPADTDANHPAMQFVRAHEVTDFPAVVLVSPDGQSRRLALAADAGGLTDAITGAMEDVLHSPVRKQILEKAADNYAVVLLLEGPEAEQNAAAREVIETAIEHIREQLDFLPKPISQPPVMAVLDRESLAEEDVLLWTLDMEPEDINEPHAAVFYGRGRWIGPLFRGEALAARDLAELLFVIGADCECGLDHRWLQGTMMPLEWDEDLRGRVAENLGFDPENPMIKMEMVSIIRRGMGGYGYAGTPPFGYREMQVGADSPAEASAEPPPDAGAEPVSDSTSEPVPEPSSEEASPPAEPVAEPTGAMSEAQTPPVDMQASSPPAQPVAEVDSGGMEIGVLAASLGGMAVVVAVASLAILLRARKT